MATFNINKMSADTIIIGDNNKFVQTSSLDGDIVRDEADSFFMDYIPYNYYLADGHKKFTIALKESLENFYQVEVKIIFLDRLKIKLQKFISDYTADESHDNEILLTLQKMMFFLKQEISILPKIITENTITQDVHKNSVFISYSHCDKQFLDELKRHFKPIEGKVHFWDDSQIKPGQKWREEIERAMNEAKVAVLLISADFFNSEFITTKELPKLLEKADKEGTTIISVVVKPCMYEEYPELIQYQILNDPKNPISFLDVNGRESMWVELVRTIKGILIK